MHKYIIVSCLLAFVLLGSCISNDDKNTNQSNDMKDRVEALLSKMTIEEKVGQMTNIGLTAITKGPFWNDIDSLEIDPEKIKKMLLEYHIGSIQNKGIYPPSVEEWNRMIAEIQDVAMNKSRMGIPVLMGIDAVHGANYNAGSTLFPHQIACAATWNPKHAEIMGEVTSYEMRASSTPWNYAPVLDVSWQPLWGRIFESFGEDTYLTSEMGEAFIRGSQGDDISDPEKTAVCLKHFIGYGNPYNGKDRSPSIIPFRELKQYYLPPFQAAIEAGAMSIMLNSGSVNGIPGHANHALITKLLKEEMGFQGFTISDWDDISKLVNAHYVAHNEKEAVKMAVMAGMDMCMVPYDESFAVHLTELVKEGSVPMERIDDAVRRILRVKFMLGIFEKPMADPSNYKKFGSQEFADLSYEAACECLTLLKNENNILPLNKKANVLVTGPAYNSINYLNGAWSRTWSGVETDYNDEQKATILEAIVEKIGESNVSSVEGVSFTDDINSDRAYQLAQQSDVIVACLGELPATEKPSDTNELDISRVQTDFIKKLSKSGKPIIVVLLQGRPRVIREIEELSSGVIMAYVPGQEGGNAIADVLFGDYNPCGRLPYTYPRYSGSVWKYNHKGSDEIDAEFGFEAFTPQWEFGEGLSYTTFEYSEPELSTDTIRKDDVLEVKIKLTNTGKMAGKEVVQLYTRDMVASVSPDVKKLVRFTKVHLEPGQEETINFSINSKDLAFVGIENEWITEPGEFKIFIGGSPKALKTKSFYYKE